MKFRNRSEGVRDSDSERDFMSANAWNETRKALGDILLAEQL